jgi:hypothetical protein
MANVGPKQMFDFFALALAVCELQRDLVGRAADRRRNFAHVSLLSSDLVQK